MGAEAEVPPTIYRAVRQWSRAMQGRKRLTELGRARGDNVLERTLCGDIREGAATLVVVAAVGRAQRKFVGGNGKGLVGRSAEDVGEASARVEPGNEGVDHDFGREGLGRTDGQDVLAATYARDI